MMNFAKIFLAKVADLFARNSGKAGDQLKNDAANRFSG